MAIYVLAAAGMRDRMEVGLSVVLPECPEDGPQQDIVAHARDQVARELASQGVTSIGFELFRDRIMEDPAEREAGG